MEEKISTDFVKETIQLADGRQLIYYNFTEAILPNPPSNEKQSKASKE